MKPNLTKIYLAVASFAEGAAPFLEALAKVSRGLASEPEAVAQPEAPTVTEPEAPAPKKRGPNKPRVEIVPNPATGTKCSICGEPQVKSPGGITCKFGHGGAPAADETAAGQQLETPASEPPEPETPAEVSTSTHDKDSLLALCKPISGGTFDGAAEARKELTQLVKKYGGTISKMNPKHYDAFASEAEAMIKQYVK